jgi:ectoine hydroxylase-related dioxygenase (phytanoyl-CoA dioxygenase family)
MVEVSGDEVARYRRDGAVCVRGVFDGDQIAVVRRVVDAMLADPGPYGQTASRPGEPAFFEDFCNWQRHPDLLDVIDRAGLPELCGRLMGSDEVRLYHDHVLVKEPGARQATPWHQDQPFYNVSGRQNISAWIPVDPVTRTTTLEFVAGSHDGTWYLPTTFLDQQGQVVPGGQPGARARRRHHHRPGGGLGARARRRGAVPHAHPARRRGQRHAASTPGAVAAVPR